MAEHGGIDKWMFERNNGHYHATFVINGIMDEVKLEN